jgi:hypothetical protein
MKYILSLIISGALVVSGFGQTRNVLVGTNNAVVQPTNFWSADASNARTGLGLGTAATSSVSAFQPASTALSNLATGNGGALSNLQATNLVGIIPASNISTVTFTNIGGTLAISSGGTGATNAVNARQNLGSTVVGDAVFIATNAAAARTAIGALATDGNAINLTNFPTLLLRTNGSGAGLTNITAANISGSVAIANGGTGATNAAIARTNLELGWSALTNTNASTSLLGVNSNGQVVYALTNPITFTNLVRFGTAANTNTGSFASYIDGIGYFHNGSNVWWVSTNNMEFSQPNAVRDNLNIGTNSVVRFGEVSTTNLLGGAFMLSADSGGTIYEQTNFSFFTPSTIYFIGAVGPNATNWTAPVARTNIGLPWSGLTNTNAATFQTALFGSNTNPVLVNTNGEVVSPTNFWAVAPISTTVQYQTNITGTSTNAATNSRNLFLFSLSPSVSGITNTVTLPTNPATTFEGDRATITHLAQTTNAVTAVRQLGAATNLITLNQLDETVLLMYRSGAWRLADNISYVEPIFFSGTNAAVNAAASRTNLGLGTTNEVQFGKIFVNGVFEARSNVVEVFQPILITDRDSTNAVFQFETESDSAIARTNLKIPLTALTNTNNANFQAAVFVTNAAPTNTANVNGIGFNTAVHWMEVTIKTNGTNATFRIPLFQ